MDTSNSATKNDLQEMYKVLYESSSDAIMLLCPPDWGFIAGNPATLKMFGVKNEQEFIAFTPSQLSPETQPDGQNSADKAKQMIEKAVKEGTNFFEWTHKRSSGEEFAAEVLLTHFKLNGKDAVQATIRDISERKKLEEELEKRADSLEKINKLMTDRELKMIQLKKEIEELKANKQT